MFNHKAALHDIMCALHPEYAAKSEEVAHLAMGGMLGQVPILNGSFAGGNSPHPGQGWNGSFGGSGNPLSKPFSGLSPSSTFNASMPNIDTTNNFHGVQNQGIDSYNSGMNGIMNAYSPQMTAGDRQMGAAGNIGTQAGNVSGLATGANGLGGVLSGQQSLGQTLLNQSNGVGPNPAMEQYKQNVNQGIAQNSGMIASTKGLNPALAARMGAQSGAAMQQGAAGSEATLQAQQQLAAQQQLGQNMTQQGQTIEGQGNLYSTAGGMYGAQSGAYGGAGQTYHGAAETGAQQAGLGSGLYSAGVTGQNAMNNTITSGQSNVNTVNAGTANENAKLKGGMLGGGLNALGTAAPYIGSAIGGLFGSGAASGAGDGATAGGDAADLGSIASTAAHGGQISSQHTGGTAAPAVDHKALSLAQALMAQGGQVPGKAAHPGDDPRNDIKPTVLSKGEIVLPNSVTQSPDAAKKAAEFVEQLKAHTHPTYGHVVKARAALEAAKKKHQQTTGVAA